jgi:hypothetical protein
MEFNLSTPALLFSAISLLLLAFTNRFLTLGQLARTLIERYRSEGGENLKAQIDNFRKRLKLIRSTQLFGVLAFAFCVVSMVLTMLKLVAAAEWVFGFSLALMLVSLIYSLREIWISVHALDIELESCDGCDGKS